MSTLLVTDTSALIVLDRVGRTDFLPRLYGRVVAPPAVVREFGGRPAWLEVEAPDPADVPDGLDAGEAEAIGLARRLPDATLLIDEARGRKVAVGLGLQIIGTAGMLLVAKRAGLIGAVRPLLDEMRDAHGFRLADAHYRWVVGEAGEG